MLDNALKKILGDQLDLAVANAGWTFDVVQKDQPQQQGTPDKGTVFFEKRFDNPYGFAKTSHVYDETLKLFKEIEEQWTRTTFQISALNQENPMDTAAPTASDIANRMKLHMNSRFVAREFIKLGVGLERTGEISNLYFEDDKVRYEAHPSFDIVLIHIRTIENTTPAIVSIDLTVDVVD